jgi:predicted nucleic acid-binding protein
MGSSDGRSPESWRRLETADARIALTAIVYDAPLITRNGSDYSGVPGLKVITEVSH